MSRCKLLLYFLFTYEIVHFLWMIAKIPQHQWSIFKETFTSTSIGKKIEILHRLAFVWWQWIPKYCHRKGVKNLWKTKLLWIHRHRHLQSSSFMILSSIITIITEQKIHFNTFATIIVMIQMWWSAHMCCAHNHVFILYHETIHATVPLWQYFIRSW